MPAGKDRRRSRFCWPLDTQLSDCIKYAAMKLHVDRNGQRVTEVFAALGDPTRRRIVELLADGRELRLSDLAREFDSARQTVTRHLDVLGTAGITKTEWRGRERLTSLSTTAFDPVRDWLGRYDRFWDARLDELKKMIEEVQEK
jgi:DNA-binding transcriptional ArsR family regulator